jgi:hypothetical protein
LETQKTEGVRDGWGKLHNEELHDFYPWSNIASVGRSRWMIQTVHVAGMQGNRNAYKTLMGRTTSKPSVNGRILKHILQKQGGSVCTGLMWCRTEIEGRLLSTGDEI